jgi:EAL domain-containing protein (putative c-di-GMP-specific phosphodiesterase class I)
MPDHNYNIVEIIKQKSIITHFQPLISIKQKALVGLEALSRGIDPESGEVIPPTLLFEMAEKQLLTVELDRLCRQKALESFQTLPEHQDLLLAINLKTSIVDQGVVGSNFLLNQVTELNLDPDNIMIEIVESEVNDIQALARFVGRYRSFGFLIALDDFGSGYSNLERILLIKPDVLKIDHSLVSFLDQEHYKQEMFQSLVGLSHKLGALVVAEGIEREEEAILAHELGVDILQGYYFAKPAVMAGHINQQFEPLITRTADQFKKMIMSKIEDRKLRNDRYEAMIHHLIAQLATVSPSDFDSKLTELITDYANVECIYILDQSGIQISNTISGSQHYVRKNTAIFSPAQKGADQSLKDYYLSLHTGLRQYVSDSYISMASGNFCVTISAVFNNAHCRVKKFILCLDISMP